MRVKIINQDDNSFWIYNVSYDMVLSNMKSYEILYFYDETLYNIVAIDIAVKNIFGVNTSFSRDTSIHDYICGTLKKHKKSYIKNIIIQIME